MNDQRRNTQRARRLDIAEVGEGSSGPVDAQLFFELSAGLRAALQRVNGSTMTGEERARWQQRLVSISATATRDLARAHAELLAAEAELRRYLQRAAEQ